MHKLSAVIVSYNNKLLLGEAISAFKNFADGIDHEIVVVDNNSSDGSASFIKSNFPDVSLIVNDKNLGYASACNIGARCADGEYILILNNDAILLDKIGPFIDYMDKNPGIAIAGCAIYDNDMILQPHPKRLPHFLFQLYTLISCTIKDLTPFRMKVRSADPGEERVEDVAWVSGCFMLARKKVLEGVDYMDERYFFYYEDADLCKVVKEAGYGRVVYYPLIRVCHIGGGSTNFSDGSYINNFYKSSIVYFTKHKNSLYTMLFSAACIFLWAFLFLVLSPVSIICGRFDAVRNFLKARYALF